ncbi:MAG: ABC transporter permease subunit/CPBP intramembrane protease [Planctomycetota bacterium]
MNWRNIHTVWTRELRDQLRDRRTLFMVAVLPLLMYPLMGMTFFQLAQFMRSNTARVLVVGAEQLDRVEGLPPLIEGDRFAPALGRPDQLERLAIETQAAPATAENTNVTEKSLFQNARRRLANGDLDVLVFLPEGFAKRLAELQTELKARSDGEEAAALPAIPQAIIQKNPTRDSSRLAGFEVERLLNIWREQVVGRNLAAARLPAGAVQPFELASEDVANVAAKQAGLWAKLLPFVVFVWALTGAFYPAVDLCAGEKERGTLETLLVSPASRGDLVWGKLLTVITFSMATALLNLAGIAATGSFISKQLGAAGALGAAGGLGLPPASALLWLVVALPPIAALFSALSFACASFARSTKEGQYYFMPLFLCMMPLMLMPLSPGIELNLGNSLAPVMGLVLLLRSLMSGDVLEAVRYAIPVTIVTFGCCLLAIRWAVSQFNQESVLFRGDDRFDLRLWLRNLLRRKSETPTIAMAVVCVSMIFLLQFAVVNTLLATSLASLSGFAGFVVRVVVSQASVLLPALVLAGLLVRNRRRTFLIRRPASWGVVAASAALALAVHPAGLQLAAWIRQLYPLSDAVMAELEKVSADIQLAESPWMVIALIALLPAICEELTFRGFVLSGLRRSGSNGWAIVISAVAFGAVHAVFQQALAAALVGMLIGYLAVITRSLWPCIAFHATYNALPVLTAFYGEQIGANFEKIGAGGLIFRAPGGEIIGYHFLLAIAGLVLGGGLLKWIEVRSAAAAVPADGPENGKTHADPLAADAGRPLPNPE